MPEGFYDDDFYGDDDDGFYYDDEYEDDWMSDAQVYNRIKTVMPYPMAGEFSTDALMALDPRFRGVVADAVTEAEGDPYGVYSTLGDEEYQNALTKQLLPEYDDIAAQYGIDPSGDSPERRIENMRTYQNAVLENFYAKGAPSRQRNMGDVDLLSERFGGQPYPGGEYSEFGGPGFEGDASGGAPGMGAGGAPGMEGDPGLLGPDGQPAIVQLPFDPDAMALSPNTNPEEDLYYEQLGKYLEAQEILHGPPMTPSEDRFARKKESYRTEAERMGGAGGTSREIRGREPEGRARETQARAQQAQARQRADARQRSHSRRPRQGGLGSVGRGIFG